MAEEKTTPEPKAAPVESPQSSQPKEATGMENSGGEYGKKGNALKWIVIYLIIAAIIYGAIYYFV